MRYHTRAKRRNGSEERDGLPGGGVSRVISAEIKRAGLVALVPLYVWLLRHKTKLASTVDDYIDLAFQCRLLSLEITPLQRRGEIRRLLATLEELRPRNILEIGTARGGTLYLFCRVCAPDGSLLSVDLPFGQAGCGYRRWQVPIFSAFAAGKQKVALLRSDSHDPCTATAVRRHFSGQELDFLFIDGDHSYDGVRADFENFVPLVRSGGLVAFHDVAPGPENLVGGVPRFWREIRGNFHYEEFIESDGQGGCGLGLLWVR